MRVRNDANGLPSLQRAQPAHDVIVYVIRSAADAAATLHHSTSMMTLQTTELSI